MFNGLEVWNANSWSTKHHKHFNKLSDVAANSEYTGKQTTELFESVIQTVFHRRTPKHNRTSNKLKSKQTPTVCKDV